MLLEFDFFAIFLRILLLFMQFQVSKSATHMLLHQQITRLFIVNPVNFCLTASSLLGFSYVVALTNINSMENHTSRTESSAGANAVEEISDRNIERTQVAESSISHLRLKLASAQLSDLQLQHDDLISSTIESWKSDKVYLQ
jgi:hypothetical protein